MSKCEIVDFQTAQKAREESPAPDRLPVTEVCRRPMAIILPPVKLPYDVRMDLMGMTAAQLNLVWRKIMFRDERDEEAALRWLRKGERTFLAEKRYIAALSAEREEILTLALRFYPAMARRLMRKANGKPTRRTKRRRQNH